MKFFYRKDIQTLSFFAIIAFAIKLTPFLISGLFAFGHDTGFYRRYLVQPIVSFPNTPVPGLDHTIFVPRIILDIFRTLFHQPDFSLYSSYLLFSLLGTACIYIYSSHYLSKKLSLYATGLYILSSIQFLAYQNFFFKETVALPIFLLTLLYLEQKKYPLATIGGVLIILTQQTTSIILICIIALGFAIRTVLLKEFSIAYIFSGTAVLASYLFLHPHVAQKIASPPVGIFLTQTEYIVWSLPIIVFAFFGVQHFITSNRKNPVLFASILVPLCFIVFHLPFYNRIYVFSDMFLILPAAYGIEKLFNLHLFQLPKIGRIITFIIIGVYCLMLGHMVKSQSSFINTRMQQSLAYLNSLPPNSSVITSPDLLPWVQGWSVAKVYAPGNLKEPHSHTDWKRYWSHQDNDFERRFLNSFPKPLYIFVNGDDSIYLPDCAYKLQEYVFGTDLCK